MKRIILASLFATLLSSCGVFGEKKEVGPYGDKRSSFEKLSTYEDERYDDWVDKMRDPKAHKRNEANRAKKQNP